MYHKTDTHWNNFGAYAAHSMLMNKLGKAPCSAGSGWYIAHDRLGDLAAMIYPAEEAKDMQLHNDYELTFEYTSRFRGLDDISITTSCGTGEGNLLMYRDSYGEAILPYMAECFSTAEFSRAVPYRLSDVQAGDTVIIELVERNIGNLQKSAPVMEATKCGIPDISAESFSGDGVVVKTAESGSFTHIYGVLPEECFSGDSHRIIVETDGTAYEAFNCFEEELLENIAFSPYGFSLHIPKTSEIDILNITVQNSDGRAVSVKTSPYKACDEEVN